jgi:hypothetical protein
MLRRAGDGARNHSALGFYESAAGGRWQGSFTAAADTAELFGPPAIASGRRLLRFIFWVGRRYILSS